MTTEQLESVLHGYVTAMLWANAQCNVETCTDGREIGECEHTLSAHEYGVDDFDGADLAAMRDELRGFIDGCPEDFAEYLARRTYDPADGDAAEHFGHDVALTRNGHGAGFWDRGLGELGDRLTENCEPMGSAGILIGAEGIDGIQ